MLRIAHKPGPAKLSLTVPKLHSGYRVARPGTRTLDPRHTQKGIGFCYFVNRWAIKLSEV